MDQKRYLTAVGANALIQSYLMVGLIVGAATAAADPLGKTATISVVQAAGVALALFTNSRKNQLSISMLSRTTALLCLAAAFFADFSVPWYVLLFGASSAATLASSRTTASLPTLFPANQASILKKNQSLTVAMTAASMALGPLLVSHSGLPALLLSTAVISTMVSYLASPITGDGPHSNSIRAIVSLKDIYRNPLTGLIILNISIWTAIGLFNVIEVPMLKFRFSDSPYLITAVFLISLLFNLLAVSIARAEMQNSPKKYVLLGGLGITFVSSAYLLSNNLFLSFVLVASFGILNGIYNLSVSAIVIAEKNHTDRIRATLLMRLSNQIGVLLSASVIFVLKANVTDLYRSLAAFCLGLSIFILVCFCLRSRRSAPSQTKIMISLFVTLSILVGSERICSAAERLPTFRIGVFAIPTSPDPGRVLEVSGAFINSQLFHFLYRYDSMNNLVPDAVESHSISSDAKTFRITLKPKLHFADGTELDADDVVFSLNRALQINGNGLKWALGEIKGYERSAKSVDHGKYAPLAGLKSLGSKIVEIQLKAPSRDFLRMLATPYFGLTRKIPSIDQVTMSDRFKILEHSRSLLRLKPLKESRLAGVFDEIQMIALTAPGDAQKLIEQGKLDFAFNLPPGGSLENFGDVQSVDTLNAIIVQFNLKKPLFKEQQDRCAFAQAFHDSFSAIPEIGKKLRLGLPYTDALFKSKHIVTLPPQHLPQVELIYLNSISVFSSSDIGKLVLELAKRGVKVKPTQLTPTEFFERLKTGHFEAAMWGYGPDYFSADAILNPLLGRNQQFNFSNFSNENFDGFLSEARAATDDKIRLTKYENAFEMVLTSCPLAFLGTKKQRIFVGNGFSMNPPSSLGIHTLVLERDLGVRK